MKSELRNNHSDFFDHILNTLNSLMDASVLDLGVYFYEMERWNIPSNQASHPLENYHNHIAEWVRENNRVNFH